AHEHSYGLARPPPVTPGRMQCGAYSQTGSADGPADAHRPAYQCARVSAGFGPAMSRTPGVGNGVPSVGTAAQAQSAQTPLRLVSRLPHGLTGHEVFDCTRHAAVPLGEIQLRE